MRPVQAARMTVCGSPPPRGEVCRQADHDHGVGPKPIITVGPDLLVIPNWQRFGHLGRVRGPRSCGQESQSARSPARPMATTYRSSAPASRGPPSPHTGATRVPTRKGERLCQFPVPGPARLAVGGFR